MVEKEVSDLLFPYFSIVELEFGEVLFAQYFPRIKKMENKENFGPFMSLIALKYPHLFCLILVISEDRLKLMSLTQSYILLYDERILRLMIRFVIFISFHFYLLKCLLDMPLRIEMEKPCFML